MKALKLSFLFALLVGIQIMTSLFAQYTSINNGQGGLLQGYVLQGQQQDQWCWAASGAMVMTYVSPTHAPQQCTEANDKFGGDCCNAPSTETCNEPGWPNFSHYGYNAQTTPGTPLTFEQIKAELEANSPICFSWRWYSGGGHMMTVSAWATVNGVPYVYVQDPWPVNQGKRSWMPYVNYVTGQTYTHGSDIYSITR